MLYRELLIQELQKQKRDFISFFDRQSSELVDYLAVLEKLSQTSSAEVELKLEEMDESGALPSAEMDASKSIAVGFSERWRNHETARHWAWQILQERTTFAADASQILLDQEVNLPVGAVQVGWFENPHSNSKSYQKQARFSLLSPKTLLEKQDEPINYQSRIEIRRFEEEVAETKRFLERQEGWQAKKERMPVAFYDGALLFSVPVSGDLKNVYISRLFELVKLSEDTKVPLVGYIARSKTKDLLNLLDNFEGNPITKDKQLFDADILFSEVPTREKILQIWGDRTTFFYSKRKGLSKIFGKSVGFVYLQTTGDSVPARLEIPSWIYENGLLDELLDVVRAECVIGLGYPYILETADQTAVISSRDRDGFLRALQEFAEREKLNITISRKTASKGRRR